MKRKGIVGVVAASALAISAALVPSAHAAPKTILVWADNVRGPQLKTILDGNTTIAPGYKISVKFYSALDALQSAWDKATAAGGPDIMTGPASFATQGAASGKIVSLPFGAIVKSQIPAAAISAMSYKGKAYGMPTDLDTTAFVTNNNLYGAGSPATLKEAIAWYNANKTAKGLTGGFCAVDGTWGSQGVITALGGGAWKTKGSSIDASSTLFNSTSFKNNIKTYLLDSSGKSNGFFQWDGCGDAFKAGKIPFAITGAWNYDGFTKAGVKFTLSSVPGLNGGNGQQWVNYSGAYVTSFAKEHGVALGAQKVVMNYLGSVAGQVAMYKASKRPPANTLAISSVTDPLTLGVTQAGSTGMAQISPLLDDKAGGTNWYDTIGAAYTDIFVKGKDVSTTLDAAAAIINKNFKDASANL